MSYGDSYMRLRDVILNDDFVPKARDMDGSYKRLRDLILSDDFVDFQSRRGGRRPGAGRKKVAA